MKLSALSVFLALSSLIIPLPAFAAQSRGYVVVASEATLSDPAWREVASALIKKHRGTQFCFDKTVEEVTPALKRLFPRHVCFVARPEEAGREFVRRIHRLTRQLDEDPYTDCFWGILTGYDAENALRIARIRQPLSIRKAVAGTSIPLELFQQGTWYCELKKNKMVRKSPGGRPEEGHGPDDTTSALVDLLNRNEADLFVTSGHATERDWQIGYAYRNGYFRCQNGRLYGIDTAGIRYPVESANPKVYMAVGNCLMGHIDNRDAMALAYLNSAGVAQMLGYTVNTWYGYAGWGALDYFVEQPGRFTLTEAFFANDHALMHRLASYFPELLNAEIDENGRTAARIEVNAAAKAAGLRAQDGRGLLYDRDVLAFYGDPAWEARLAKAECGWEQTLTKKGGVWTLEIKPLRGERSFSLLDPNGSQRGGRPVIEYFPYRLKPARIVEGADLKPVIADDFILVPTPARSAEPGQIYRVIFEAERLR